MPSKQETIFAIACLLAISFLIALIQNLLF